MVLSLSSCVMLRCFHHEKAPEMITAHFNLFNLENNKQTGNRCLSSKAFLYLGFFFYKYHAAISYAISCHIVEDTVVKHYEECIYNNCDKNPIGNGS